MHRLLALVYHRGAVEGEGYGLVTIAEHVRVRRSSINREITRLDGVWVHRIAKVDNEVSRLSRYHATASRISGGDRKTNQIPVGEGILLRLAVDGYSPIRHEVTCFVAIAEP